MRDIAHNLGQIAKSVEKYDQRDTMRVIGMVLTGLPEVLPNTRETEHILNNCGIYAKYIEDFAATGEPEIGSKKNNLIVLHAIKTLKEAEDVLLDSDFGNARELCMMCYRRGRQFLPEEMQPNPAYGEVKRRIAREKKIAEKRGRPYGM